ncbi:hypothetical protein RclHR1_01090023 [Rhizophagus clarus]|uniref:Uncharacterized protein n=1 Tax=Rhizophagus clarus TaxID=94130 RepID=A0A2Z6QHL8_9GLOM|nr:hypothetical protein RclHR1_01090023 [Rhizophagus clarus]
MMNEFPESQPYMTRVLHPNRNSWAKAYTPFQFNTGIQILNQFLTLLVLSWHKFQISQSFTYKGNLVSTLNENLVDAETANDNFIEDIIDEPQITLTSLLNGIETSDIIEMWRIRCIGGLSSIETSTNTISFQITCTFQSLHYIQGSDHSEVVHQNTHQQNKFEIAFSTAKTAINVALKTNSDHELITLLKDFIESKREKNIGDDDDIKENHDIIGINESSQEDGSIILLQKNLIEQITDSRVTKIRGVPLKKRLKSAMEVLKKRILMQVISDESNTQPVKQKLSIKKTLDDIRYIIFYDCSITE